MAYRFVQGIVLLLLPALARPATEPLAPNATSHVRVTCEQPYQLTRDCSLWQGPQRQVVFAGYSFRMAADDSGRTVLIARVHELPASMAGMSFGLSFGRRDNRPLGKAVERIARAVGAGGIALKGSTPYLNGRRIEGYFLHFSGDAYSELKRHTNLRPPIGTGPAR